MSNDTDDVVELCAQLADQHDLSGDTGNYIRARSKSALAFLPEAQPEGLVADSGMSGEAVQRAEWLWTNLPIRHQTWGGLQTHEKAMVCHAIERLTALSRNHRDEALERARRDSEYYEGAKAYAVMYEQNPEAARKWLLDGCGDRAASYARALKEPKP